MLYDPRQSDQRQVERRELGEIARVSCGVWCSHVAHHQHSGCGVVRPHWTRPHENLPREAAATMNDAVREYLAGIGRKGGKVGGKIGGLSTSPAKVAAARENGKKGGRPKKSPSK